MMEHTTDRMFWTLTSIIVAALLLTLGVNTFPKATQNTVQTFSGMTKQADVANTHVANAASDAINGANGQSDGLNNNQASNNGSTTNTTNANGNNSSNSNNTVDNKQASNSIQNAKKLGLNIANNGDGTVTLEGFSKNEDGSFNFNSISNGVLNIPKYVKDENNNLLLVTKIGKGNEYGFHMKYTDGSFNAVNYDNMPDITSINIPNSITSIDNSAFENNKLKSLSIPNSVKSIGPDAFNNNQLTSVNIPNSVTNIGSSAFRGNQLTYVKIPHSITTINPYTFADNQLTSVDIPNSVTFFGYSSFANNQLTYFNIPNPNGYQFVKSNGVWYSLDNGVIVTNNPVSD